LQSPLQAGDFSIDFGVGRRAFRLGNRRAEGPLELPLGCDQAYLDQDVSSLDLLEIIQDFAR
jgi:hypothetical protein